MGFYDSVKDDIREENGETTAEPDADDGDDDMPFDHLKDGAESDDDGEQQGSGSDTQIEVLTDEGLKPAGGGEDTDGSPEAAAADATSTAAGQDATSAQEETPSQPQAGQDRSEPATDGETAGADHDPAREDARGDPDDELLATLQRIERQNDDMLDVLRGIKRSLNN